MTIDELKQRIPGVVDAEWHQHKNGGGWVQNTATVDKTAFIEDSAIVYGDARVYGNAIVYGNARVYGNAIVYGDAHVSGNARVGNNAKFEKSPLYIVGTKYSAYQFDNEKLGIGCEIHTVDVWERHGAELGRRDGFTDEQIEEYFDYVHLFAKRIGKEVNTSMCEEKTSTDSVEPINADESEKIESGSEAEVEAEE